jgi:uncharacterized protein YdiU (UPF0061 family)
MLGQAIYPLIKDPGPLQAALSRFENQFQNGWNAMMADKIGLAEHSGSEDEELIRELLEVLQLTETDMTIFFRSLADLQINNAQQEDRQLIAPLLDAYYDPTDLEADNCAQTAAWIRKYLQRIRRDGIADGERRQRMNSVNPKYVLRNYLAQLAIDRAEKGDHQMIHELLELLRRPYDDQPGKESYAAKRPEWARSRPGCSMLSCSS